MAKDRLGLALSGGGYRAAAFHLGTFKKFHQLGLLDKIDAISTISGGSIAGVFFLLHYKGDMDAFEKLMIQKLKTSTFKRILFNPFLVATMLILIATPICIGLCFSSLVIGLLVFLIEVFLLFIFQFTLVPLTKFKIRAYDQIFFDKKTLNDLPKKPTIAINATNMETGTLFTFSQNRMSDSSYQHPKDNGQPINFKHEKFPLAHAVASSTAVPFIFNPVKIKKQFFMDWENTKDRANPSLVDGGVYDNQGVHKLTQSNSSHFCDIVVCSDGSMPFNFKFTGLNSLAVLYRSTDLMMRKIKSMQFVKYVHEANQDIAYFSLNWDYERVFDETVNAIKQKKTNSKLMEHYGLPSAWLKNIETIEENRENIRFFLKEKINYNGIHETALTINEIQEICKIDTQLKALTDREIELLSRHAARLAEIHIRLFCPGLHL